jgi:hypothetical protein
MSTLWIVITSEARDLLFFPGAKQQIPRCARDDNKKHVSAAQLKLRPFNPA